MPFELVPFICGAALQSWWPRTVATQTMVIASVSIGTACAALAGELALPAPVAVLAIGADTLAAAAGSVTARLAIRIASQAYGRG